jgi:hypothetical protein
MMLSEAPKYHAYARECLQQAEIARKPEIRKSLIELSRIWMEAALREETHYLTERISKPPDTTNNSAPSI